MNSFHAVAISAKEGRLSSQADIAYYASDAFYKRIRFQGKSGTEDQRQILLHMLGRIALDTRDARRMREYLEAGVACLQFFGVANPVSFLQLPRGSAELAELTAAVEANLTGPLAKAVQRVRRRRNAAGYRARQEDAVLARLRNTLPWPDSAAFKANREEAQSTQTALVEVLEEKCKQLRARHQTRCATLYAATAPGLRSWTDIVTDIALNVLKPH